VRPDPLEEVPVSEKVKLSKDGNSIDFVTSDNLPTSVKKFRQSPEIEGFYRFIFENDLQREAYEILNRIIESRKSKKALDKKAAKEAARMEKAMAAEAAKKTKSLQKAMETAKAASKTAKASAKAPAKAAPVKPLKASAKPAPAKAAKKTAAKGKAAPAKKPKKK
jgi:hypothetical protein